MDAPRAVYGPRPRPLALRSTEGERAAHASFIQRILKGASLWLQPEPG